jgi:hypothetical protein
MIIVNSRMACLYVFYTVLTIFWSPTQFGNLSWYSVEYSIEDYFVDY